MNIADIENKASELLEQFNLKCIPTPIEKLASKLKLSIIPYDLGSSVSGALFIQNEVAAIGVNPSESGVRRRFTIAHELGHYILHKKEKETLFVDKKSLALQVHFRDEESSTGARKKEREANAFAAAILMPADLVKEQLGKLAAEDSGMSDEDVCKFLSRTFEVSPIAMSYRLTNLGLFNPY